MISEHPSRMDIENSGVIDQKIKDEVMKNTGKGNISIDEIIDVVSYFGGIMLT